MVVIVASVAVGWYIKDAPSPNAVVAEPASPGRYLLIAGGSDPYWDLCVAGAQAFANDIGAELDVRKPTGEGEEGLKQQIAWLTELKANEFDGLAIGPIDPVRQTTLINSAAEKLTVITVDSDAPTSTRMFYIGSSNVEAGSIAANMVREALPKGGKVAVLMASEAKTNAVERKQGLQEILSPSSDDEEDDAALGDAEYEIVGYSLDHGDFDTCRKNVIKVCKEHDDIDAILGTFGYHGPIILESLSEVDGTEEIKVVVFDEDERTLTGIDDGRVFATVVQDPFMFGAEAVQMLEKVRNGQFLSLPIASGAVGVHCRAITESNIDEFRAQLRQRLDAGGNR